MTTREWVGSLVTCVAIGCGRTEPVVPRTAEAGAGSGRVAAKVADDVPPARPVAPPPWSPEMQGVADGVNQFALDLHRLRATSGGNAFCSPFSLHAALAMTAVGARGTTLDELRGPLRLPEADGLVAAGDLARHYGAGSPGCELSVASALWGQDGVAWKHDFLATLDERFNAGFRTADFAADPERERQRINADVAEVTHGLIGSLVPPGTLTPLTRLCLTNAIYFKGSWLTTFDAEATSPQPFHRPDGSAEPVLLMHRTGTEAHFAGDGFQLLALPYVGGELEMVVLLPATADGLDALEARLDAAMLAEWRAAAGRVEVSIWLPRFRLRDSFNAVATLRTLGVAALFDTDRADLSGMTEAERLAVGAVIHEAFVDVNEEGTEAAAATAVIANLPSPPPPRRVEFRADRPFLFLIRDARHGTILFLGRCVAPH